MNRGRDAQPPKGSAGFKGLEDVAIALCKMKAKGTKTASWLCNSSLTRTNGSTALEITTA